MRRHRPIAVAITVLAACVSLFQSLHPAAAKGPEYITIGGGDLGQAYYAIPEPGPVAGWLGLLPNDPATDTPEGIIPAPRDASAAIAGAYELYFDDLGFRDGPHAYYVPADPKHGPELYWRTPSGGMDYVAWFSLNSDASAYLDRAVAGAHAAKAAGATDPDWISAMLRHDGYYAAAPSVASDGYRLTRYEDPPGVAAARTFNGPEATELFDQYVATLHNWHPVPAGGINGYKVYTTAGREVFTYAPATATTPARVMPAEAGGVFDATGKLENMLDSALGRTDAASAPVHVRPTGASTARALVAALIAAAGFAALLGGAHALVRRNRPATQ